MFTLFLPHPQAPGDGLLPSSKVPCEYEFTGAAKTKHRPGLKQQKLTSSVLEEGSPR